MSKPSKTETMNRHEFLRKPGLGGAALMAAYCASSGLSSCKNENNLPGSGTVGFTLNLVDEAANAALKNTGGYLATNGVVVAHANFFCQQRYRNAANL